METAVNVLSATETIITPPTTSEEAMAAATSDDRHVRTSGHARLIELWKTESLTVSEQYDVVSVFRIALDNNRVTSDIQFLMKRETPDLSKRVYL